MALTEHQKQSILHRVASGEKPAAVARAFGVHRSTVGSVVKKAKEPGKKTSKRGRGDQLVAFRLASGELDGLDRLVAGGVFRSRSDGFRKMLRLLTGYFDPEPGLEEGLQQLLSEVSSVGNNLNQATRAFHRAARDRGVAQISDAHLAEIRSVQDCVVDVQTSLRALLKHREKKTKALLSEIEDL